MISASSLICEAREPLTTFVRAVSPEVKVQKVALYALSAASGLASCVSLLAPALSAASLWTAGLFVPLAGFSLVTAFVARLLKDYDNPIDLYQMRQEAKQMSYESLIYEHGSLNPINAHEIVDPFSLQKKFEKSCEGKPLSKILDKTPLTQILSASLLSQKTLRRLCIAELYQLSCIDQLFERVDGIDWYELSRYGAISSKELETLEKLHSTFKKVDLDYRSKLFELHTECMGRRSFVLLDLEQREKKAQEDLSYGYGQTRRGSLAVISSMQTQLALLQQEKRRVQTNPEIGRALQLCYDQKRQKVFGEYSAQRRAIEKEFEALKNEANQALSHVDQKES